MLTFGITGGIGSGKSVVCSLLVNKGIPIIAADHLAKGLATESDEIRAGLVGAFGVDIYSDDGRLNKDRMRELVFKDSSTRQQINEIIHPHVIRSIAGDIERLKSEAKHRLVGVEAALIYESGMDRILDKVVVVAAPVAKRVQWLQVRDDLSPEMVQQRISTQMPGPELVRCADFVLNNSGDLVELEQRVDELHSWLTQAFD